MFVRHGQSTNNPLYEGLQAEQLAGRLSHTQVQERWLADRTDDPALTALGAEEAEQLGTYLAGAFAPTPTARCVVYTSPFRRTLDTTAGILRTLTRQAASTPVEVRVRPDIYETGGVYTTGAGGVRTGPGSCFSAAEISSLHGYDVSRLPSSGPWYTAGWETDAESRTRAASVARWLRSEAFGAEHAGQLVLLVMHGQFIDHLQKALFGIADDPSLDVAGANSWASQQLFFATPNTATSMFSVVPGGKLIVRWIGRVDHLQRAPADAHGKL
jgi:broad specificity phosphatase PhoE